MNAFRLAVAAGLAGRKPRRADLRRGFWMIGLAGALAAGPAFAQVRASGEQAAELVGRQKIWALFQQYLALVQDVDPERATVWGLHAGDDRLTLVDDGVRRKYREGLERFLVRLESDLAATRLDEEGAWEAELFKRHLESELFDLRHLDRRTFDPRLYLRPEAVDWVLDQAYAGLATRGVNAVARMAAQAPLLARAPSLLSNPPRVWTEHAILETEALLIWADDLGKRLQSVYEYDPALKPQADAVIEKLGDAIDGFQGYLKIQLLPRSNGEFAIGEELYVERLAAYGCDASPGTLRRRAKSELRRAGRDLKRMARELHSKGDWREVLAELGRDRPSGGAATKTLQDESSRLKQAVEAERLAASALGSVSVLPAPGYLHLSRPFSAYYPVGAFDDPRSGVLYAPAASALESKDDAAARASVAANRHRLQVDAAAMTWPGLHWLAARAKAHPSPIRRALRSPLLVEGWPLYSAGLAEEAALYGSELGAFAAAHARLVAAAEAVLDVELHTRALPFEQAAEFLTREGALPPAVARAEAVRITREPGRSAIAIEGWRQIERLRRKAQSALGEKFTPAEFHERLAGFGALSPDLVGKTLIRRWEEEARAP